MSDNIKLLVPQPSLFTAQLTLVVMRLRDIVQRMEGYVQKPGDASHWYDLWSGHIVQLERCNIGGASVFNWTDCIEGWTITATLTPSTSVTRGDVIKRFEHVQADDLGHFNLAGEAGTAFLQDPDKVFDKPTYSTYPPSVKAKHLLDPLVVNIHSITSPEGKRINVPKIDLTAPVGSKVSGIYTVYANGTLRYGHTDAFCAPSPQARDKGLVERLAVIDITVRNKADSLDGLPTGISIRVLEQHADYSTGPEITLAQ